MKRITITEDMKKDFLQTVCNEKNVPVMTEYEKKNGIQRTFLGIINRPYTIKNFDLYNETDDIVRDTDETYVYNIDLKGVVKEELLELFSYYYCLKYLCVNDNVLNMMELGAGYGGQSGFFYKIGLKMKNIKANLLPVEAEPLHVKMIERYFKDNKIETYQLIKGAVDLNNGIKRFYFSPKETNEWFGQSLYKNWDGKPTVEVKTFAFKELLEKQNEWTIIHSDIQEHEGVIFMDKEIKRILENRVKMLHIATHSKKIENDLKNFYKNWILLFSYDCGNYMSLNKQQTFLGECSFCDGVISLINPKYLQI